MNILPKKRWHVRTKENIARVRKDEAEAAEKERQENLRIEAADREARLNVLKQKSKLKLSELDIPQPQTIEEPKAKEHINLFSDLEHAVQTTNKEHDKEIKEKQEEYEKKIGYLTYLGQDTNEALGKKNWYDVPPESSRFSRSGDIKDTYDKLVLRDADGKPKRKVSDERNGEVSWKSKQSLDPINAFKKFCFGPTTSKVLNKVNSETIKSESRKLKSKSDKNKSETQTKMLKLREARLKRELEEKVKAEMFLSKLSGTQPDESEKEVPKKVVPKYNSQFNPDIARQNFR